MILGLLIFLGTIFQGLVMFKSGLSTDLGIPYLGPLARDGVWHQALVGQLTRNIPPINPGMSGEMLINYHYYYDLLVSFVVHIGVSTNFLIYRFFPILLSVLLGIGTYKLSLLLFKNKRVALFSVFFTYFASSFGWIIDIVKNRQIGGESAFWANQPVSMNINPPYAISLVIIVFTILLINSYLIKPKVIKFFGIVFLSGTLVGFKVYGGAILLAGLFILSFKRIIFDKDWKLMIASLLSLVISFFIFSPSVRNVGLLEFKPLWLVDTMIDAGDRVGIPNFTSRRFAYMGDGKWLHFAVLEIICIAIFFIGNLGTRIIGFWGLKKKQLRSDLFILIFSMMVASLVPTLLFIQKGNTWNIIQFMYYFLFFAGLFAGNALKKASPLVIFLVVIFTPISSLATFRGWLYPTPPAYLPKNEYEALQFLRKENDGIVLKHPFDKYLISKFKAPYPLSVFADNAYVSAYSGKSVFIEDVEQQIVLNTNYKDRLDLANRFFIEKNTDWSNNFLLDNNISYIYLPKIYELPMAEEEYQMTKIFENDGVNIYKVK